MKIIETDIDVLTGPTWLFESFKDFTHPLKPTAKLKPSIDPDGDPIIGMQVLTDPDWEFISEVSSPDGETLKVRDFLTTKKYKYYELEI